jgi:hypothetical protein
MITSAPPTIRELNSRIKGGLEVRLLWRCVDGSLFVAVTDSGRDEEFYIEVRDRSRALDVFHHPYAYAAHHGVAASRTGTGHLADASVSA